jgi:aminoglycoside phosphotransferase
MVHHVEVEALIRSFAQALRRLHELPIDGCPFDRRVDHELPRAGARVDAGAVDAAALSPAYRRYAPARLHELLVQSRPAGDEDLVVVHGSYGLNAIHLEHGAVTGYVDLARAGIADRYVDLAIAARELARTISPEALGPFFVEYGIDYPDLRKIDFYVLLDELV